MSRVRISCVVIVTLLMPLTSRSVSGSQPDAAVPSDQIQQARDWAADVIRGDSVATTAATLPGDNGEGPDTIADHFVSTGQGLMAQIGGLIEQRIGWLRPTSVKDQAIIWMALAMALPWGFVGWIKPIVRNDGVIIRTLVVGAWTGIALWSAWKTWGMASGADRFASTMLFGVPILVLYFNTVVRSVAQHRPSTLGACDRK